MEQTNSGDEAKQMRKLAGRYIKSCREARQLTQSQLAKLMDIEWFTTISQIENGHARLPPEWLVPLARVLNVPRDEFAKKMLMYYAPSYYSAIFGAPTKRDLSPKL